jgi:hypothetical protein
MEEEPKKESNTRCVFVRNLQFCKNQRVDEELVVRGVVLRKFLHGADCHLL